MASFWQKKPEMTGCNDQKNALRNILSKGVSYATTQTKIEEADLLNSQNQLEKAYGIYKDILGENPRHTDALFGIGVILEKQLKFDLAIQFLSKSIESKPDKMEAFLTRGRIFRIQSMFENAISDFTKVISNHPDHFEALIARGITFGHASQFNAAIDDFSRAIKSEPNRAEAFYNRGVVYEKLHQFESAIEDYSITIKLNPYDHKAYNNRGVARREIKCFDAALQDFNKSIKIHPDFAEGYYNKSLTLLSIGKLKEGFRLYEYRWKTAHFQSQLRHFSQPLWLGNADLAGKTILLHSEQGLGDSIQFCRYIKFFKNMKCRVLLEIEKPLMSLMQCLLPKECIFEKGSCLPKFDYHCPLMSLPHAFGTKASSIPFAFSYLHISTARKSYWQKRLGSKTKPRVGFAWKGNLNHINDYRRSIPLDTIIDDLSTNIEWISLQKDLSPADRELIAQCEHLRHFGNEIGDFLETASLCSNLDAILSIDSSAAHLSGAIGKPVHLLLAEISDARWCQSQSETPWYENTILYRRSQQHSWNSLLKQAQANILNQLDLIKT